MGEKKESTFRDRIGSFLEKLQDVSDQWEERFDTSDKDGEKAGRKWRETSDEMDDHETADHKMTAEDLDDKTIRITMLGSSTVGKTVFLSAIYQKMFLQPRTVLHMAMDARYGREEGYASIENIAMVRADGTVQDFPTGTSQTTIYGMSLQESKGGKSEKYCDFEFIDYRGQFMTDIVPGAQRQSREERDREMFREQLTRSDYLLLFLDAVELSQSGDSNERYTRCKIGTFQLIFNEILGDGSKEKRVLAVITKIDHAGVCEADKRDHYKGLCEKASEICQGIRNQCRSFAIIPVSAVGEGVTEERKVEGTWVSQIIRGATPNPINVDGAILYACRDILLKQEQRLTEEMEELSGRQSEIQEKARKFRGRVPVLNAEIKEQWEELGDRIQRKRDETEKIAEYIENINRFCLDELERNYVYDKK